MEQIFNALSAGRVLDVATGRGGFASYFLQHVKEYDELVGIDSVERNGEVFAQAFADRSKVSFHCMDAAHLDFPDASFDTVCMASSLHHMADPAGVLSEMVRVLRPGGNCILTEMYRDNQSETQLTHVLLHHWWAEVDSAGGVYHHLTFSRAELIELLQTTQLEWRFVDQRDLEEDPFDAEGIRQLDAAIDLYIKRARDLPQAADLIRRGEELRQRVHQIGFHGATQLIAMGKKSED
jgi:ubiquinone/menaquinone biosynthesis C-methylase UbiE